MIHPYLPYFPIFRGREGNRPPPPKEEPRRGGGQRGGMEGGDGGSVGGSGGGGRHDSQEIDFDERPTLPPPQIPWDHQVNARLRWLLLLLDRQTKEKCLTVSLLPFPPLPSPPLLSLSPSLSTQFSFPPLALLPIQVYNPNDYNLVPQNARFFVIKSYSEMDVQKSIKYGDCFNFRQFWKGRDEPE